MNDAEILVHMGTDAQKWAHEWCRIADDFIAHGDTRKVVDEGWMIGWFANAIEAGRMAGEARSRCSDSTPAREAAS